MIVLTFNDATIEFHSLRNLVYVIVFFLDALYLRGPERVLTP